MLIFYRYLRYFGISADDKYLNIPIRISSRRKYQLTFIVNDLGHTTVFSSGAYIGLGLYTTKTHTHTHN